MSLRPARWVTGFALALGVLWGAGVAHAQVTVRSSVSATRIPLGESLEWTLSVEGAMGAEEPAIPAIDFARVVPLGTSQNMSWVNGVANARTVFSFRVTPVREGRYEIPAVTVRAKGRVYTTDAIALEVTPPVPGGRPTFGAAGGTPRLRLVATVDPRTVVVGEPVIFTIRFYQGTRLIGEAQYAAPETPGFYVEPTGAGRSYYEGAGPDRWLVGERRTVLYPTIAGRLRIGPATMECPVADPAYPNGLVVSLSSDPVTVDVRPLPPAPAGFRGAVAAAQLTGAIDRTNIRADESVQVTFRLTGSGNLRLAAPPEFDELADFQVHERKVTDSLDVENGRAEGAKIVRYTLLPRRPGTLVIPALTYVTYVPGEGYRSLDWTGATITVAPGLSHDPATNASGRPFALVPTPQAGGMPWTAGRPFFALALIALGFALVAFRHRPARNSGDGPESAARLAAVSAALEKTAAARTRGDAREFWRLAEEALDQAEDVVPGEIAIAELRAGIARARYAPGGGSAAEMDRAWEQLKQVLDARRAGLRRATRPPTSAAARAVAVICALLAVGLAGFGTWRILSSPDDATLAPRLAQAAQALRGPGSAEAQQVLVGLWNKGAERPGVAINLALGAYYDRRLGEAALWSERARRLDPRHPLVTSLIQALGQEDAWHGLPEGAMARTTGGELAFAAACAAFLALVLWAFTRGRARLVAAVALACGLVFGGAALTAGAAGEAPGRAVILATTPLADRPGGPGTVELEPGRAVWLEPGPAGWARVRAGQVTGYVPSPVVRAL